MKFLLAIVMLRTSINTYRGLRFRPHGYYARSPQPARLLTTLLAGVLGVFLHTLGTAAAEPLPFEIQNGRGASGLVFTLQAGPGQTTKWSRLMQVTVVGDAAQSAENLRIASPLRMETESGEKAEVTAKFEPAQQSLAAGATIPLELSSEFKAQGLYRGELLLVQAPRQRVIPIQVTVSAAKPTAALPIQEHGGKVIAATGSGPSTLALRLQNIGAEPIDVKPTFTSVARVDKPENPTYQIAISAADAAGEKQTIKPGDVARFDLPIKDLDEAGIYVVDTVIADPSGRYLSQSIKSTVYRREAVWFAVVWIAIGALLAWLVRWYVSDGNKRMGLRRRIALLIEQIRIFRTGGYNESVIAAARVLELDIEDRHRDVRWGGKIEDIERIIARAELRFALLRECATALERMEQIDADAQAQARKTLDVALTQVRGDQGNDENVRLAHQSVLALGLDGVRREQLRARLTDLTKQIANQKRAGSAELKASMLPSELSLAKAEQLLRTDRLDDLEECVDQARDSMIGSCVEELERLAKSETQPMGVAPDKWQATVQQLKLYLKPAREGKSWTARLGALQEAQKTYFSTAIQGLIAMATEKANGGDSRADPLRNIAAQLTALLVNNLDSAAALYWEHLSFASAPDPRTLGRGVSEDSESKPASGLVPLALLPAAPKSDQLPELKSAVQQQREIQTWGWLVNLAVFIIAVATGAKTLWLDNLAWGGYGAWLLAFLWGAGFQATGDAFTSLVVLRAKLGGLAVPP